MTAMRPTVIVLMLASITSLTGCAATANLGSTDGCKIYGGTQLDATLISEGMASDSEAAKKNNLEPPVLVWEACCGLVDLPFSFLADTVMLPLTVPLTVQRLCENSPTDEEASKNDKTVSPSGPRGE
jgi:uncharacterized protein YceK